MDNGNLWTRLQEQGVGVGDFINTVQFEIRAFASADEVVEILKR